MHVFVQAEDDVTRFLNEEHDFKDYTKEVVKYLQLKDEIEFGLRKVTKFEGDSNDF